MPVFPCSLKTHLPAGCVALTAALASAAALAQTPLTPQWTQCAAITADNAARLACFDLWAARQGRAAASPDASDAAPRAAETATATAASAGVNPPATPAPPVRTASAAGTAPLVADSERCAEPTLSAFSRFWELEPASDCGTFGIRSYRPLSLSWIGSDSVNAAPSSSAAEHTAPYTPYGRSETRVQLSVRTKIARGLLTDGRSALRDSLWFGYTQQSYWQLFNSTISRPFRSTDHEPELIYILPLDTHSYGSWRLRYAGLSLAHQSNGQSLPLSRSWNRAILMAGLDKGDQFTISARAWARLPEKAEQDDNPDISNNIGRAEVAAFWNLNPANTLGVTLRHSLRQSARGSVRLEWLRTLGPRRSDGAPGGLRFHAQLFSGYGDSLLDYNRRRVVLSLGLSLIDF